MSDDESRGHNGANPYVGPVPFGKSDPLYGRDREVRELRDLLISQRIVVFYSPSGAGKTSLIEANAEAPRAPAAGEAASEPAYAGLRWELERARFRVLPVIRVNQAPRKRSQARGNRYVRSALLSLEESLPRASQRGAAELARMTLAEYLAEWPPAERSPTSDVLIFDQFEEFLTLDATDQEAKEAFLTQVREVLWDGTRWALFALREDHLGGLDPYAAEIPTHLTVSYRLNLLGKDAAKLAIQRPAARAGAEFTDDAAERLLDDLRRVRVQGSSQEGLGPHIEPVHLQVVCQRLWDEATKRGGRIDPGIVAKYGAVDDVLGRFYAEAVAAVARESDVPERTIRGWFDEQLITSQGIRGQVIQEEAQTAGLPARAVDALVGHHLVRREPRRGVTWLELAHDRLIGPILADNSDWYPINLNSVQQAAKAWHNGRRQPGFLLTGEALTLAEEWAAEHPERLTDSEREFLDACRKQRIQQDHEETKNALAAATLLNAQKDARIAAEEDLLREAEQRVSERTQAAHRIKRWAAAAALLALVAVGVALFANNRRVDADAQRMNADAVRLLSSSQLLAKQAQDEPDRDAKLLLLAEALHAGDTLEARLTMLETMQRHLLSPQVWKEPIHTISTGTSEVRGVAFLDSTSIVSVDAGGSLRLWSTTGEARDGPRADIGGNGQSVAFANDGVTLVTGGSAGVQLWNARTLEKLQQVSSEDVTSVGFSFDGKEIVFGGAAGNVSLYEIGTAKTTVLRPPRTGATSRVNAVTYSSAGWIAAGRADGTISLWQKRPDASTPPARKPSIPARGNGSNASDGPSITSLAFNPKGDVLAAGDSSGTITRWGVDEQRNAFRMPLIQGAGALVSLAYSPDGAIIAAAEQSGRVGLWEAVTERLIETLPLTNGAGARSVAFSPDGAFLASGDGAGEITVWSRVGLPLAAEAPTNVGLDSVAAVAFSRGARTLAAGGAEGGEGIVRLCDTSMTPITCKTFAEGGSTILSLAFSQSGDRLAWGDGAGAITIANLSGDQESIQLKADSSVEALTFSSDDRLLIAGTAGEVHENGADIRIGSIVLWDLSTPEAAPRAAGTPKPVQWTRSDRVTALASSPIGPTLASFDQDTTTWSITAGALGGERRLQVPTPDSIPISGRPLSFVRSLAFDAEGTKLAAAGGNGVVWTASTGEVILHEHPLMLDAQSIAFATDGSRLASGHTRGHIRVWDLEPAGDFAGDLSRLTTEVVGLVWFDASTLIAVGADGLALKLIVDPAQWKTIACRSAGRGFTPEEVRRYFPDALPAACPNHSIAVTASPVVSR